MKNPRIDPALEKAASLLYAGDLAEAENVCRASFGSFACSLIGCAVLCMFPISGMILLP